MDLARLGTVAADVISWHGTEVRLSRLLLRSTALLRFMVIRHLPGFAQKLQK